MRSSFARRWNVALIVDTAIAVALICTVTFFTVVMEYRVGSGELTRAELRLRADGPRLAHAAVSAPSASGGR